MFRSGQGVGSIAGADITILNDNIVEEVAENFTVRLTTIPLQPVHITGLDSATVTIQNDDGDGECTCNDWSVDVRIYSYTSSCVSNKIIMCIVFTGMCMHVYCIIYIIMLFLHRA